jgi:hypothetical protein
VIGDEPGNHRLIRTLRPPDDSRHRRNCGNHRSLPQRHRPLRAHRQSAPHREATARPRPLAPLHQAMESSQARKTSTRPELRIHDLRRTLAEDVWTATHDIRAVQAKLGRRSPTPRRHAHARRKRIASIARTARRSAAARRRSRQRLVRQFAPRPHRRPCSIACNTT